MKRVFASILMTVVILLSLLVPAAGEMIEYDYPRNTVSLWNADENWTNPGSYVMDTENQLEGEGCVSINLKKGASIASRSFDPVDATGMLALEFDMYISDLAILDCLSNMHDVNGVGVQISSEGDAYKNEKNYTLTKIARSLKNGCPKVGWNHVIVFLDDMVEHYGPFDISHINYLRLSWINEESCDPNWILKFDNFVLTDREVAPDPHTPGEWQYDENKHWRYCTECDKKIDETFHSEHSHPPYVYDREFTCYACKQVCGPLNERGKYANFIQQVKHLRELSEDDFDLERMKEQYNALISEWGTLAEDEHKLLMAGGYEMMLEIVERAIDVREEELSILSKHESLIAELTWLKDFLQEADSDWTWENWQRACDIASGTRATIDDMTRSETKVLSKYGYIAILEEAEDRLIIYDPPPQGTDDPMKPDEPDEPNTPDEPESPQTPAQPVEPSDEGCSAVLVSGAKGCLVVLMAAAIALKKRK